LLSIIIPTYNERENIVPLIGRVTSVLRGIVSDFEIIVVDDDSPDETWKIAGELTKENSYLRVIRRRGERGLATAVVEGWKAARGEILGVMDGDQQHPPETLVELLHSMLDTPADIVVASRNVHGGGVSEWSLVRRFISWGAASIATLFLPGILRAVRDPMSGYFLVRRCVIDSADLQPKGYKILLEVFVKGKYRTIAEVPYIFQERKKGGTKLGPEQIVQFVLHLIHLRRIK
jgi:dolichol-phosphate mannosyltransferase